MTKNIMAPILLTLSLDVLSCSFVPMIEEFKITEHKSVLPSQPNFTLGEIHRGSKGDIGSCRDVGSIKLFLQNEPSESTGYIFRISEGVFEDQLFYDAPVKRVEKYSEPGEYSFRWLDGLTQVQEPIDITIEITAVSASGARSEPQYVRATHPGVKKPWWQVW